MLDPACMTAARDDQPPELHELAADYEILGELGRGSSSTVYRARDRALEREVAIKLVRADHVDDELLERAAQEARLLARLPHHPHIVTIYAVRRLARRSLALVVQYVHGPTLRELLRREGAQSPERIMRVLRDVARALHFAHGFNVVHRDVKPENVYLDEQTGRVLLSDFGAATLLHQDARLTATGEVIGTPAYMSPEQLDDTPVDGRSDIYSLGLVGWEMATGMFPWGTVNLYEVLYRRRHTDLPHVATVRPELPPPLVNAIEGALERDPARRWPTAAAMLGALLAPADTPLQVTRAVTLPPPTALPAAKVPDQRVPTAPFAPAAVEGAVAAAGARAAAPAPRPPESLRFTGRATRRRILLGGIGIVAATTLLYLGGSALDRRLNPSDEEAAGTRSVAGEVALEQELAADLAAAATAVGDSGATPDGPARDSAAGGGERTPADDDRRTAPVPPVAPTSASPRAPARTRADSLARCGSPALADQRACLLVRLDEEDAALNRVYGALIGALRAQAGGATREPPAVRQLREQQRAWLVQRDRSCAQRARGREGPLWAPDRAACLGALGRERARELQARLDAIDGG